MWFIFSVLSRDFASGLLPPFLIIKDFFFFTALCVDPFYEAFCVCVCFVFVLLKIKLICFCFFRLRSTQLFHFWGSILFNTLQGSFNLCYFSLFLSSVSSLLLFKFYQCLEVTVCGWWYIKIKELSLFRSTHLFLVMFFLAHHRAPLCSEHFPLFFFLSTHIVSVVLFFSAAQVFSMGLFTCVNVLHFHSFF